MKLLRYLFPVLLFFLFGCNNKKTATRGEIQVFPKNASFYEEFIFADNKEKDTLLYFKIDLLTRKWSYNCFKGINVGVELATEEFKRAGYPSMMNIHYTYSNNVRGSSGTLVKMPTWSKSSMVSYGNTQVPEIVAYKSFTATNNGSSVGFAKMFNVVDSINYLSVSSNKNPFECEERMNNTIANLKDDLKKCLSHTNSVIMKTTLSDSEAVHIFQREYLL